MVLKYSIITKHFVAFIVIVSLCTPYTSTSDIFFVRHDISCSSHPSAHHKIATSYDVGHIACMYTCVLVRVLTYTCTTCSCREVRPTNIHQAGNERVLLHMRQIWRQTSRYSGTTFWIGAHISF